MRNIFLSLEVTIIKNTPPSVVPPAGNQRNPIVIRNNDDDPQFMERRVPPVFFPRVMLRPAGVQPEGQAQAVPVNQHRRRRQPGNQFRVPNDHCFNCGKLLRYSCVT